MAKDTQGTQPPPESFRDTDDVHVNAIHARIVAREQKEPEEGFEPTPWWVWTISVLLLFAMGFYLGRYSGSWSTVAHEVESPQIAAGEAPKKQVRGDLIYVGVCQTCHQPNGLGVAGQYPPLAGSEWLTADAETPIRIVLYGLEGPIAVRGGSYNNKMPPFHDKLSDEEIAAVLTHARSSWGNAAGAIKPEEVAALRSLHGVRGVWSAAELHAVQTSGK
jgi:mono/diheme cytochrome c family protein